MPTIYQGKKIVTTANIRGNEKKTTKRTLKKNNKINTEGLNENGKKKKHCVFKRQTKYCGQR